jgi:hypothetical protein
MDSHKGAAHERGKQEKRLLAKRKHQYLYAGALLFLITFSARELLRDALKEKADSIVVAENTFLVRADALRTSDRQIMNLYVQRHAPKGTELSQSALKSQTEIILSNAYAASMQDISLIDAESKLASAVDLSDEDQKMLADLERRRDEIGTAFQQVSEAYFLNPDHVTAQTYDDSVQLIRDAGKFESDAFAFSKTLIDAAENAVKRRERLYRIAWWVCFVLFIVSWYVAFQAKTYDVDVELAA